MIATSTDSDGMSYEFINIYNMNFKKIQINISLQCFFFSTILVILLHKDIQAMQGKSILRKLKELGV